MSSRWEGGLCGRGQEQYIIIVEVSAPALTQLTSPPLQEIGYHLSGIATMVKKPGVVKLPGGQQSKIFTQEISLAEHQKSSSTFVLTTDFCLHRLTWSACKICSTGRGSGKFAQAPKPIMLLSPTIVVPFGLLAKFQHCRNKIWCRNSL